MRSEARFRGALKCVRSSCRTRWFAEPLEAGDVRRQLEEAYLDSQIVKDLMIRCQLPETIDQPMYLQLPITLELWSDYARVEETPRTRTIQLLKRLLAPIRRAS
jgi:hypothetical protein